MSRLRYLPQLFRKSRLSRPRRHALAPYASRPTPRAAPARILVDGTKLLDEKTDGIKRYVDETIRALASEAGDEWRIDVELATGVALPLSEAASWLAEEGPVLG